MLLAKELVPTACGGEINRCLFSRLFKNKLILRSLTATFVARTQ
jgi:hypothetical protein